jgi:hypothetical protein
MEHIAKRAALAVLGVIITLAYWSFRGAPDDGTEHVRGIPSLVWEGDGGTLSIDVESTTPARFSISFSDEKDRSLDAWTTVGDGSHNWVISIPRGAGGYIELGAENPKVGDKLSWKISLNGDTIEEQSETLEEALKPGYAFFLQSAYEDYSAMKLEEDF